MLNANAAREITNKAKLDASMTKVFKRAIKKLEQSIKDAALEGKNSFECCIEYFNIHEHKKYINATQDELVDIREYMVNHGYEFFFHIVKTNYAPYELHYFTCKW